MNRVGVLVHPTRPVNHAVETLRRWTEDRDLELVQIPVGEQPVVAPPGKVTTCDLVAAIGGDGTVLKALHAAAKTRTPVLGVACGSLGVLTSVPANELRDGLDRFADGDWAARQLPALALDTDEGQLAWAINDVVISRKGQTQLVVDLCVDGELYVRSAGDGVVIATPLGSSAYSMAARGALLSAGTKAFICTPLAMHGGCAPPLTTSRSRSRSTPAMAASTSSTTASSSRPKRSSFRSGVIRRTPPWSRSAAQVAGSRGCASAG
jgi:NAD+ kinase